MTRESLQSRVQAGRRNPHVIWSAFLFFVFVLMQSCLTRESLQSRVLMQSCLQRK